MNRKIIFIAFLFFSCSQQEKNKKATDPHTEVKETGLVKSNLVFEYSLKIKLDSLTPLQITHLAVVGKLWGFFKYFHPIVTKGEFNWDGELFKILPKTIAATSRSSFNQVISTWIEYLGQIDICNPCGRIIDPNDEIKLKPDFTWMTKELDKSIISKLAFIFDNRQNKKNYYVDFAKNGNPLFKNENGYESLKYPNPAFRLLALFRYWNIVQYYYPYKYLIDDDWNTILRDYIPKFIEAKDSTQYTFTCLELIGRIRDTHSNIWGDNDAINNYYGKYFAPIKTMFIDNQLVVTGYYLDTLNLKKKFKIGDIITKINSQDISVLVKNNIKFLPASNNDVVLRDLPLGVLMRSRSDTMILTIVRGSYTYEVGIKTIYRNVLFNRFYVKNKIDTSYRIIPGNIGYVRCDKYHANQLDELIQLFQKTKGMIIDLRCYPSEEMYSSFATFIKSKPTAFVKFSIVDHNTPGLFIFQHALKIGEFSSDSYRSPVVVLVNSETQSAAEFTTMALQSATNVKVVGSTTAGADGDASEFLLPGGILTMISGIGVYYPDGSETQRKGIKIDYEIRPTLKGIIDGRDELLEKAIDLINNPQK